MGDVAGVTLLAPDVLGQLPPGHASYLTGREFFPQLISGPFADGLPAALDFPVAARLIAPLASQLRGDRYHHGDRRGGGRTATKDGTRTAEPGGTGQPSTAPEHPAPEPPAVPEQRVPAAGGPGAPR